MAAAPALVEVVRNGFIESTHRGNVVALDADGSIAFVVGDPDVGILPRSAVKPAQAAAMVGLGLGLTDQLLALAAASHSGEPMHLDGVRSILSRVGLDGGSLQCPAAWPFDESALRAYVGAGAQPAPVVHNCSGKHAAMLATCVARGWSTHDYLDPDHPLQVAIRVEIGERAGASSRTSRAAADFVGTDGCGAPLVALSLRSLALVVRSLALGQVDSPGRRVCDAIQTCPEWTSGSARDEARLMRAIPGLTVKMGAEAVFVAAFDDGRAVALTIEDGGDRARPVVMAAALARLGVTHPLLDELVHPPVLGGGVRVGELRATGW